MSDNVASGTVVATPEVLGITVEVVRLTWKNHPGLSFDLVHKATGETITVNGSFDEYPDMERIKDLVREMGPWVCVKCGLGTGPGYHLASQAGPGENRYVCDDCWDERLR